MNNPLVLEIVVVVLGLGLLLLDLWLPMERRRTLGYAAAGVLLLLLAGSFLTAVPETTHAFGKMYVQDALAVFFKRLFLFSGVVVLVMAVEFFDKLQAGLSEFFALVQFALAGMLFAASTNDFALLFVAVELITVTFYVLTSFQRNRVQSLEAGVKYLILGALSSAFMVFGIALIYGTTAKLNFGEIAAVAPQFVTNKIFLIGLLLVIVGLGFKIAAFPFQMWAPDVYQGSPTPVTAFLAVGSKAAGFVLLLRVLFGAAPQITAHWPTLLMVLSGLTILYGNLCALPQRNLKRLLGYSSISNAGYLLLGVAALSVAGQAALLYYLAGYVFTVLAAFLVLTLVLRQVEGEDITALAGLSQRSPMLAAILTLAMVSLAGVPPLAGFFGKFLLLKSVVEQAAGNTGYYWLVGAAVIGVVISLRYYFGVIQAIYWSKDVTDLSPIAISMPMRLCLWACAAGVIFLGLFPGWVVNFATAAAKVFR